MPKINSALTGPLRRALLLAAVSLPTPLLAQNVPVPSPPSRAEIEAATPPAAPQQRNSEVSVDASRVDGAAPCPLANSTVSVALEKVQFEAPGGGPVPAAISEALKNVRLSTSGSQSITAVCAIRDEANAALSKAGYVASVQIPPQEIADGTLRLIVVSARLVEVRVVGNVGNFRATIEERAATLKALDPLNRFDAERILLLAGDIPGLRIALTLRPASGAPGDVIGELKVDTQAFSALANFQNYGSPQLGREILSLRGEAYGLTGMDDRTYLSYSNSLQWRETHVIQGGHDMGLGGRGFRIGARASYAMSNPDIENLDLRSRSLIAGIDLSMPLIRTVNHNIRASGGFEWLMQRTVIRQNGVDAPFTRDNLRMLFARIDGDYRILDGSGNEIWSIDAYAEARKGLGILGASKRFGSSGSFQPSRFDGDPQATILSGEIRQTIRPFPLLAIDTSIFGQWSNHSLLNLEEFSIGSLTYGRGYDPGANGADRVIAARIQPRFQVISPKDFGNANVAAEIVGFYDWVKLYNLDPGTLETGRQLRSAGGGLRVTMPSRLILDVMYAKPLDYALATDTVKPKGRVLVSLTMKLFPWGAR